MAVSFDSFRSEKIGKTAKRSVCRILDKAAQKLDFDPACFKGHLFTILKHKRLVFIHCARIGMPLRGLLHDMSKFSPREFYYGVKYFKGDKSPNEGEREAYGYSMAWMHHKGRNRHHFEYWTDYNLKDKRVRPVKMPQTLRSCTSTSLGHLMLTFRSLYRPLMTSATLIAISSVSIDA